MTVLILGASNALASAQAPLGAPWEVAPVFEALTSHGITATALHSHLVGEEPKLYYMHFWADASLTDVLRGLRAALDAAR